MFDQEIAMKKKAKKLRLRRETLTTLDGVSGGVSEMCSIMICPTFTVCVTKVDCPTVPAWPTSTACTACGGGDSPILIQH